ncbi:hypothetical protein [Vulgatibacter incomptus]|uniref:Xylose isomerase-like TIM barrel domain-containing protein n=1 Tax=Vulgatibacter incomptus TaxID=1391653 RepID=A0A0K1PGZ8_9BACT|nr:hypothetical protein [Vulgatibacter incomptus]AKU92790.1 hypothetical protein AKJ08_3177 [Vulgatibacter incomptus]
MRALLSTRLFAAAPLEASALQMAARAGFPSLELYAQPPHTTLLGPGELTRIRRELRAAGVKTPWLRLGAELLGRLRSPSLLSDLVDALEALQIRVVTASMASLPKPRSGATLELDELALHVEEAGARLVLDTGDLATAAVRSLPLGIGLGWDLADYPAPPGHPPTRPSSTRC